MHELQPAARHGLGLMKLGRRGEALVQEIIVQQPKLRHRKTMAAR
jgi:hypothetical protein